MCRGCAAGFQDETPSWEPYEGSNVYTTVLKSADLILPAVHLQITLLLLLRLVGNKGIKSLFNPHLSIFPYCLLAPGKYWGLP